MCWSASAPGSRRRACYRMTTSYSGHASLGAPASREPREGQLPFYVHQGEALDDIQRRYPTDYRVRVDDKLGILTAMKKAWGEHRTTLFPCHEKFPSDRSAVLASIRPPDITVESIADLLEQDLPALPADQRSIPSMTEVTR
jgi:hypothetical protein